jgi:hypothetical protein
MDSHRRFSFSRRPWRLDRAPQASIWALMWEVAVRSDAMVRVAQGMPLRIAQDTAEAPADAGKIAEPYRSTRRYI